MFTMEGRCWYEGFCTGESVDAAAAALGRLSGDSGYATAAVVEGPAARTGADGIVGICW